MVKNHIRFCISSSTLLGNQLKKENSNDSTRPLISLVF